MNKLSLALIQTAAWIEEHEGYWSIDVNTYNESVTISDYLYDVGAMSAKRREIGGKWDKETTEYQFSLTHAVSENITVKLSIPRDTACTPRVVGTETVEMKDYDAVEIPTKSVVRDVVEWDCNPILDTPKDEMDNSVEESARKARVTPSGIEE